MLCFVLIASLLIAAASARSLNEHEEPEHRIIGGKDAVIETFRYQVSLQSNGFHFCGGSIISSYWVLTAGHCIDAAPKDMGVRAGSSFRHAYGSVHQVDSVVVHENYAVTNDGVPLNDIALVHVTKPFVFDGSRQPIKLFKANEATSPGAWAVAAGWGTTGKWYYNGHLQSVKMPIVSKRRCQRTYGVTLVGYICAGFYFQGDRGTCQGDSGGALVVGGRQAGIVSFGPAGCVRPYFPGVYTEVAYYRNWIKKHSGV